ncbi:MAG: hypothetical protein ABF483_00055 [Liquorilactobacillus nagelii]|jgi:hypothetical protein|uniref:hypothetical protein n=1 Tax=Liquorilactobacillus nagelii TaxID=82688 RepID=UPI0006EF6C04|nr:hypothetical protein [Liquorilactobacillus nagelii]KRL40493.1 hypothetical protein FD45_GL001911 [Liquorilactobacillus nagelii DSM 13675]MCI1699635.1 hypothetical protein [Liquorilactobacillus nagelii]MCP9314303.1 hypothetical protein [Liquorilactobacillus nagelii]QYH54427.1 hypothetical protein G6O73_06935 [Liquorilactobacillus nagelii DSM 13675]ULQ49975.1 hypothetical protein J6864_02775 [Liquorilactobacillus nagelii]
METEKWLFDQLTALQKSSVRYQDRAFYIALADLADQQQQRLEQAEGEIDGRLWQPANW